jgi:class 3 adenylate cyclase
MCLGLQLGVVFYGNIGSKERLDFIVVGPAVNEVARIAAMCRSVDQPILISSALAASVAEERRRFGSVGRFALRWVGKPQELYTPVRVGRLAGEEEALVDGKGQLSSRRRPIGLLEILQASPPERQAEADQREFRTS